ncbi:hypothetical protein AURDEDRAFT_161056 [Auricularia subglabra TFB-10046 SS5]|nr:hypothetical protein AURDEDRAFT_161056 [Auricularia subglabra TFB-10046 SS5]
MSGQSKRRVSYFYDPDLGAMSYGWNAYMKPFRMRMTHHLIAAYGMLEKMHVLRPKRATALQMTAFHTDEYIDFLTKVTPETCQELLQGRDFLSPELDNPPWDGLFDFCSVSSGGSISAAQHLTSGAADIAINWSGGLHHAKKRSASGFCYVNDIVLCILELLRTYTRVVYIDIDCHHGDGVEEAFYGTDRVLTVSFHKFGDFFPGTGALHDRGRGRGTGYAVNVPLQDGVSDASFAQAFEPIVTRICEWYRPGAIVLQCGADSLAGDRLGCLNLSMEGHARCVEFVRGLDVPLVLLGGGGYTVRNVARTWTYETACALGVQDDIPRDLPHNEFFEWFGPRYRLEVPRSNMEDLNLRDGYLDEIRAQVEKHLHDLPFAPSVALQNVPREPMVRAVRTRSPLQDEALYVPMDADDVIQSFVQAAHHRRTDSEHAQTTSRAFTERVRKRRPRHNQQADGGWSSEDESEDEREPDARPTLGRAIAAKLLPIEDTNGRRFFRYDFADDGRTTSFASSDDGDEDESEDAGERDEDEEMDVETDEEDADEKMSVIDI